MNQIKKVLLTAIATVAVFGATFTSCTPDPCKSVVCTNGSCLDGACVCPSGFEGTLCETKTKTKILGNYKGNGVDDKGGVYTNWIISVTEADTTSLTKVLIDFKDKNGVSQNLFTGTVSTSGIIAIDNKTSVKYDYTNGSGSIVSTMLNATFKESDNGSVAGTVKGGNPYIYTFSNMVKF